MLLNHPSRVNVERYEQNIQEFIPVKPAIEERLTFGALFSRKILRQIGSIASSHHGLFRPMQQPYSVVKYQIDTYVSDQENSVHRELAKGRGLIVPDKKIALQPFMLVPLEGNELPLQGLPDPLFHR